MTTTILDYTIVFLLGLIIGTVVTGWFLSSFASEITVSVMSALVDDMRKESTPNEE